jgi:hypothetical protein
MTMRLPTWTVLLPLLAGAAGCGGETEAADDTGEPGAPVFDDALLHYRFDGCSAGAVDQQGSGLDASLEGEAGCADGGALSQSLGVSWSSGAALSCDGDGDYAQVEDDPLLEQAALTLALWFLVDADATADDPLSLLSKGNSDDGAGYWLNIGESLNLVLNGGGGEVELGGETAVTRGGWHHALVTYDGSQGAVYLDGASDGAGAGPGALVYGDERLLIGALTARSFDFDGQIDEVVIWDRALDSQEAGGIYDAYLP